MALGVGLSGSAFVIYMFFSGGMCRAALEFAPSCTLESRWQAFLLNWESALFFLPIALCIGAIVGMRVAARQERDTGK